MRIPLRELLKLIKSYDRLNLLTPYCNCSSSDYEERESIINTFGCYIVTSISSYSYDGKAYIDIELE